MRLYSSPTSPFVRKVLVAAHERQLAGALELVTLRPSPLEANPELSRANPLNKIPALILDDGTSLYDSAVICEYLDSLGDRPRMIPPPGTPERWRALRLQALADGIVEAGVQVYYERIRRPLERQWAPWIDGQLEKIAQGLDALDAESVDFGAGVDLGIISSAVAVTWLAFRGVTDPTAGRAALAAWHEGFDERPSMLATVPRE